MSIPDGHYDNQATHCREVWRDGKCVAFWTAALLRSGQLPPGPAAREIPPFGHFPDLPQPEPQP